MQAIRFLLENLISVKKQLYWKKSNTCLIQLNAMEAQHLSANQPIESLEAKTAFPTAALDAGFEGPHSKALRNVFGLMEVPFVERPEDAELVICEKAAAALQHLKAGRAVVHVGFKKGDTALQGVQDNPEFSSRYRFIPDVSVVLVEGIRAMQELAGAAAPPDLRLPGLSPSPVQGKRIMVLDDHALNLKSAMAQLGPKNEVSVYENYTAYFRALSEERPDIALLDMLMPAEDYMLSGQARGKSMGGPFPVGMFAALAAAQRRVPLIVIATDAGHHDHPAFALVDHLGWNEPISLGSSTLMIVQARMIEGVKDWGKSMEAASGRPVKQ